MIHTYLGKTIRFDIHYKNRTSIGIYMDPYGEMEVQAPKGTSDEQVLSLFINFILIITKTSYGTSSG